MLSRLFALALVLCPCPALASTPSLPQEEPPSPQLMAILQRAQKEMPLPVLKVVTWPSSEGKRQIAIEMSTAGFAWAKKPVMNVLFQAKDESPDDLEQALHGAAAAAREFIEAAKKDVAAR